MTYYVTTRDIIIPAGTKLSRASNQLGGAGYVEAFIGHGSDFTSTWLVQVHHDALASGDFAAIPGEIKG